MINCSTEKNKQFLSHKKICNSCLTLQDSRILTVKVNWDTSWVGKGTFPLKCPLGTTVIYPTLKDLDLEQVQHNSYSDKIKYSKILSH